MTEKEIVLETTRVLPNDCSLEESAERGVYEGGAEGLDQLERRHSSRRSKETACLMAHKLIWSPAARDDLHDQVR